MGLEGQREFLQQRRGGRRWLPPPPLSRVKELALSLLFYEMGGTSW